jgi:hypothetical protein
MSGLAFDWLQCKNVTNWMARRQKERETEEEGKELKEDMKGK